MRPLPVSPDRLPELLADLIVERASNRLAVAVDGAPAADPVALADSLVEPLRVRGRAAGRVSATDFLRPASVRLEHGRQDVETFRSGWVDVAALAREVLVPFAGDGEYLPSLWDAERDRATRAQRVRSGPGAVLLVDGTLLLDKALPFDLTIHVWLSEAALARRTPDEIRWTLPAYREYAGERLADVVIRADDPRHPALVVRVG